MTDHENELIIGTGQDGRPVKVFVIAEEVNRYAEEVNRYWAEAQENAQSGPGKDSLLGRKLRELVAIGRHRPHRLRRQGARP